MYNNPLKNRARSCLSTAACILPLACTIFMILNGAGCSKTSKSQDSSLDEPGSIRMAAAKGGFIGAISNGRLGRKMDRRDRDLARNTGIAVLETGTEDTQYWENPRSSHKGRFMVHQSYTKSDSDKNLICRDFTHVLIIDGAEEVYSGTACRDQSQPRAKWYLRY